MIIELYKNGFGKERDGSLPRPPQKVFALQLIFPPYPCKQKVREVIEFNGLDSLSCDLIRYVTFYAPDLQSARSRARRFVRALRLPKYKKERKDWNT